MEKGKTTKTLLSEVIPFIVMVIMEGCTIGLTIFAKTSITNGMSPFVFIVYTNALATTILFPSSFLSQHQDRKDRPPFTFSLFMRFLLLGFTGISMAQNLLFLGLSYSSPILVCAMGHFIPTFNFLLNAICRKIELNFRSSSIQVQVIGMLVSIMGGVLAEFFKGPLIIRPSSHHHLKLSKQLFVFSSTPEFWVLGGILLAAAFFSLSLANFIQKETVKQYYPEEPMKVISYYSLLGTILSAIISCTFEKDVNAWKLKRNMDLILILLTAIFGGVIRPYVQVWLNQTKGSFYVPLFKPFGIAFATTFGVCFFPNSLHYGSVIGATVLGMGYYTVLYGEFKVVDDEQKSCDDSSDYLDNKIPLLQEKMEV